MEVREETLLLCWLWPYVRRSRKGKSPGNSGIKLQREISAFIFRKSKGQVLQSLGTNGRGSSHCSFHNWKATGSQRLIHSFTLQPLNTHNFLNALLMPQGHSSKQSEMGSVWQGFPGEHKTRFDAEAVGMLHGVLVCREGCYHVHPKAETQPSKLKHRLSHNWRQQWRDCYFFPSPAGHIM